MRNCFYGAALAVTVLIAVTFSGRGLASSLDKSLAALAAVDKDGKGHAAAQQAMRDLSNAPAADLPAILLPSTRRLRLVPTGFATPSRAWPIASSSQKRPLPTAELEAFVRDKSHQPRARRLAYEWLVKVDPSATDRLIPGMLLDPAPDLRRDAVALKIAEAPKVDPKADKDKAVRLYREALSGAIHDDQVKTMCRGARQAGAERGYHRPLRLHHAVLGDRSVR